jgi:hypothetical protein
MNGKGKNMLDEGQVKIIAAQFKLAGGGDLVPFLPWAERETLLTSLNGEEAEGIADIVLAVAKTIEEMPVTYQQDGKGDEAIAHLHYFFGGVDAYITEKDVNGGVQQSFGLITLTGSIDDAELGYISIEELVNNGVELDLHWRPKTLREIKAKC